MSVKQRLPGSDVRRPPLLVLLCGRGGATRERQRAAAVHPAGRRSGGRTAALPAGERLLGAPAGQGRAGDGGSAVPALRAVASGAG